MPQQRPVRIRALLEATRWLGTAETPPGSNRGPNIDAWNRAAGVPVGSAWCMSFCRAMYAKCGRQLGGGASVGNFELWARREGLLIVRPRRGDLGCLDWNGDSWPDHMVLVERVLALRWSGTSFVGWIQYIAGNDGDAVSRRRIWVPSTSRFARVPG